MKNTNKYPFIYNDKRLTCDFETQFPLIDFLNNVYMKFC